MRKVFTGIIYAEKEKKPKGVKSIKSVMHPLLGKFTIVEDDHFKKNTESADYLIKDIIDTFLSISDFKNNEKYADSNFICELDKLNRTIKTRSVLDSDIFSVKNYNIRSIRSFLSKINAFISAHADNKRVINSTENFINIFINKLKKTYFKRNHFKSDIQIRLLEYEKSKILSNEVIGAQETKKINNSWEKRTVFKRKPKVSGVKTNEIPNEYNIYSNRIIKHKEFNKDLYDKESINKNEHLYSKNKDNYYKNSEKSFNKELERLRKERVEKHLDFLLTITTSELLILDMHAKNVLENGEKGSKTNKISMEKVYKKIKIRKKDTLRKASSSLAYKGLLHKKMTLFYVEELQAPRFSHITYKLSHTYKAFKAIYDIYKEAFFSIMKKLKVLSLKNLFLLMTSIIDNARNTSITKDIKKDLLEEKLKRLKENHKKKLLEQKLYNERYNKPIVANNLSPG